MKLTKDRKLNAAIIRANILVNNCENAVLYVSEPKCGFFKVTKKEPENYLYKISFKDGKHIKETKHQESKASKKALSSKLQNASDEKIN